MSKELDFIVIGAPKAGTTALYEYIKDHPDIHIPPSKELPFFSEDRIYKNGLNWYIKKTYRKGCINGTVTPQYILGSIDTSVDKIAGRIKNDLPNVKLIAILREPVKRAFSHYKMVKRRGYEERRFAEAMSDAIFKYRHGELEFNYQTELFWGSLYAKNLKPFYERFPKENILIIFAEVLKKNPVSETKKVLRFIGVDTANFNINQDRMAANIHQGGMKPKFKLLTPVYLKRVPGLFALWNNIVPYQIKKRIDFGINKWNVKPDDVKLNLSSNESKVINDFFKEEIKELEQITQLKTPWNIA